MNGTNAMVMLGDEALVEVSGGCRRRHPPRGGGYYKKVEQTQNQSVDIGGDLSVSGGSSVTINFGDQSQSA
jgi:hypothetical protein